MRKYLFLLLLSLCVLYPAHDAHAQRLTTPNTLYNGLVGWWTFDGRDMANGVARDRSGNGNNLSASGIASSTFYASGAIAQGGRFDGSDDYFTRSNPTGLPTGSAARTITMWVNPATACNVAGGTLLQYGNNGGAGQEYIFQCGLSGGVTYIFTDGVNVANNMTLSSTSQAPSVGAWSHLAFTFDGVANWVYYLNGVAVRNGNFGTAINTVTPLVLNIGDGLDTARPNWPGGIDDVRIYNRSLSALEVSRLYGMGNSSVGTTVSPGTLGSGLIGHWTFDGKDMAGGVARDRSSGANSGSLIGPIASSTFYSAGVVGQAVTLDGANDRIAVGNFAATDGASQMSISGWVNRIPNNPTLGALFAKETNTNAWLSLQFAATAQVNAIVSNGGLAFGTLNSTASALDGWHHFSMVFDGTQTGNAARLKLYFDGVQQTLSFTGTIPATAPGIASTGYLGYDIQNATFLKGSMDDVRVWNKALTAQEIWRLYDMGQINKISATPASAGLSTDLVAHWTFDGKDMWGGVVRDRGTGNRNGAVSGIASSTFYSAGPVGQAATFDGSNDLVDFGTGFANFQETTPFSGAAWIRANASGERIIMAKWATNSSPGWQFFTDNLQNGKLGFFLASSNGSSLRRAVGTANVLDGNWHHVAFTYDGSSSASGIRFYVDGAADAAVVVNNTSPGTLSDTTLRIGQRSGTLASYFQGGIDDVYIYGKQLSAAEVKSLYDLGR
jgi:hypothetical protein